MAARIVFLCTGNICRSPLAEVVAAQMFGYLGLRFCSAGLSAADGLPASASSAEYAASQGLSLAAHASRAMRPDVLTDTAWVIGMTRGHAAIFGSRFGARYAGAIGVLGAPGVDLAGGRALSAAEEVDDPYGLPPERYFACGDQIRRLLKPWEPIFAAVPGAGDQRTGADVTKSVTTIAMGSDHRGLAHKALISEALRAKGFVVEDFGCRTAASADYPDAALPAAEMVARSEAQAAVLICGSGIGMSIAANKVKGIRASLCFTAEQARTTRRHNDSNVLCLSGDALEPPAALAVTEAWLSASFEGGRHARRVDKIIAYENQNPTQE